MKKGSPDFATSIRWQTVNVISQVLLQLVFIMLLARLISKADFGIMSIALVVVGFIEIFAQIGIGPSLVQKKELSTANIRAALQFSLGLGLVFFLLLFGIAPQVGEWFLSESLTDVLRWIALSFIFSSIALVPRSLLIRKMEFKKLFGATLIAMIIGNLGIGLYLAYLGYGIWAYVAALLSQNALLGIAYWSFNLTPLSGFFGKWKWGDLRAMLLYGGKSTVFNWFNYAATKIDVVVVGEFSQASSAGNGWATTGIYDRSAHLMSLPITILGKLGDSVLFSGMSALQSDASALNRVLVRGLGLIGWIVIPGSLALAWFSTETAVILLGMEYAEAGPIVRILFLSVAFRSLIKLADAAVRATDRLIPAIIIKAGYFLALGVTAWATLHWEMGLEGVGWAVVGCTIAQFCIYFFWLFNAFTVDVKSAFRAILPGIICLGIATPGFWAIWTFGPKWQLDTGALDAVSLGIRITLVFVWTLFVWGIAALRFPEVLDGNDAELRKKWTGYLPKPLVNLMRK